MIINIKFTPNLEDLAKRLGADINASRRAGMVNLIETVEAYAVKLAPVQTGNLIHGISSYANEDGSRGYVNATAKNAQGKDYASWVHDGTGIYGPLKQKLTPKDKKALFWQGAAHPFRSVKGIKPNPFMTRAIAKVDPQKVFEAGVMRFLRAKGW